MNVLRANHFIPTLKLMFVSLAMAKLLLTLPEDRATPWIWHLDILITSIMILGK